MTTPLLSRAALGLAPPRSVQSMSSEGVTAHYMGHSPWPGADRSTGPRFAATTDHNRCPTMWRGIQDHHLHGRGWADIAYSAGVCPHGVRLMGRGPGVRTAANGTTAGNNRSEAICYLAGDDDPVTDPARHAFLDMAADLEGRVLRWNHAEWKPTACAGDPIRAWEAAGWPRPGGTPSTPSTPTPQPQEHPLMALTDTQQAELHKWTAALYREVIGPTGGEKNSRMDQLAHFTAESFKAALIALDEDRQARDVEQADYEAQLIDIAERRLTDAEATG